MRMRNLTLALAAAPMLALLAPTASAQNQPIRNIVLVHGAFADGSGWRSVADILRRDGYTVSIVQEPLTSLDEDIAATDRVLDRIDGPIVLVGHSYAGVVITAAGNNPKVAKLVYVAAFVPEEGESGAQLADNIPAATRGVAPDANGYLWLDPNLFPADFAAGVPLEDARFMALSQMPLAIKALSAPIATPAWKTKPSYAIVATGDRAINPNLERFMYKRAGSTVTELDGPHAIFLTQPEAVAKVIEAAATGK